MKLIFIIGLLYVAINTATAKVQHVYAVDKNILAVTLLSGKVNTAQQLRYIPHPSDKLRTGGQRHQWLYRHNRPIGVLVGEPGDTLFGFDQYQPYFIRSGNLNTVRSYSLSSQDDPNYFQKTRPNQVSRKSKPTNLAYTNIWSFEFPVQHTVYLHFNIDLHVNSTYQLDLSLIGAGHVEYQHRPASSTSEAVHVSQIGFRPKDTHKIAYLSLWKGSLGGHDYGPSVDYFVKNSLGTVVFSGTSSPSYQPKNIPNERLTKSIVYPLRFDSITKPDHYQACVKSVGCSPSFEISESVWTKALTTSFKGLYNQRSGIEIPQQASVFSRPRNMHPDDGVIITHSNATLLDNKNGLNLGQYKNNFDDLVAGATDLRANNVWGGYADAGDWDRRIQHLKISRLLAELMELRPKFMSNLSLDIQESSNLLPDALDEALWAVDFFARLQAPNGGIAGGVESAEHPRQGEASWQESQTIYAYAPDPWSSLLFAASAAKVSRQLKLFDAKAASILLSKALKAAQWAEKELLNNDRYKTVFQIHDALNLASVELYAATGNAHWHQLFLDTTAFKYPNLPVQSWKKYSQSDAAFTYARLTGTDKQTVSNIRSAFSLSANNIAQSIKTTPFGWAMNNPDEWVGWGSLSVPQTINLIRLNEIEKQTNALGQLIAASQFGLGANPSNMTFTTGVGHTYPLNPLHHDHRVSGQNVPFGLTVNGPHDIARLSNHWLMPMLNKVIYPEYKTWPLSESYLDIYSFAPMTEFSVHNTIAPNLYVWAYLASKR